jgi:hypothetical protein
VSTADDALDTIAMVRAWKARDVEAAEVLTNHAHLEGVTSHLLALVERLEELLPPGRLDRYLTSWHAYVLGSSSGQLDTTDERDVH